MWISHKRAAVLCHTPAVVTPTSTRSQISMNCTIGNHGPKKSSLLLLLSGQSHKSLAHVIQHPAWFTQLASVPDILTFPVPSYYAATKIPCSHALTPSWTFLWLLYPHHMSYSMVPNSWRLSLTICWPPALASSTFEVCHLVFTLRVCKFNAILT